MVRALCAVCTDTRNYQLAKVFGSYTVNLLWHHVCCSVIASCALLLHHVHFYCIVCIIIASCALFLSVSADEGLRGRNVLIYSTLCYVRCSTSSLFAISHVAMSLYSIMCIVIASCALLLRCVHGYCITCIVIA